MTRFLGQRAGEGAAFDTQLPARTLSHLVSIFHGRHPPEQVGVRSGREMRMLALAIDALLEGRPPQVGDILMQRFKALEMSVAEKSLDLASHLEITDKTGGLTTPPEKQAVARQAFLFKRLADATSNLAGSKKE